MDKRYQVFVSSTFEDLVEERRAVMQALLELNCIPAGMELFPASDDDAWTLIKRVIDDCDYYCVILAGRYGSTDADGISYTEKEYDYAVAQGKPVLAFVHGDPGSIRAKYTDSDPDLQRRLAAFRAKVEKKHRKTWRTAHELGTAVTTSLVRCISTHPAEGWVKARHVKTTEEAEKVTGLLEQVRTLEKELEALRELGVADTRGLAQGQDAVRLEFCDEGPNSGATYFESTWNDVFAVIGKNCFYLPDDSGVTRALRAQLPVPLGVGLLSQRSFEMVKSQCFCLGLIRFVPHLVTEKLGRSSAKIRWELTELGRIKLGELIGVKRASA